MRRVVVAATPGTRITIPATPGSCLTLRDGRQLGFAVYGESDPARVRRTVLYFHGLAGSRAEVFPSDGDATLITHGIRLITVERPGYGLSTYQRGRTLMDFADDVRELMGPGDDAKDPTRDVTSVIAISAGPPQRHGGFNVARFSVAGFSSGAPYAHACVHRMGRRRIISCTIIAGEGPYAEYTRSVLNRLHALNRWLQLGAWSSSMGLRFGMLAYYAIIRWRFWRDPSAFVNREFGDRLVSSSDAMRLMLLRNTAIAYRREPPPVDAPPPSAAHDTHDDQHASAGVPSILDTLVDDFEIAKRRWRFRLADNATEAHHSIWHGRSDKLRPVAEAEFVVQQLRACTASPLSINQHILESNGHALHLRLENWQAIMQEIMSFT
jgi:hypothetical protein